MRKLFVLLFVVMLSTVLVGCETKIDASSQKSLETSIADVYDSMPPERAEKFKASVSTIAMSISMKHAFAALDDVKTGKSMNFAEGMTNFVQKQAEAQEKLKAELVGLIDGKTGEEVIAIAEKMAAEAEVMQKEMAFKKDTARYAELEGKINKHIAEMKKLNEMHNGTMRFKDVSASFMDREVVVKLTNIFDSPIFHAEIKVRVKGKTSGVKMTADINSKAINPGETRDVVFKSVGFNKLSKDDIPDTSKVEASFEAVNVVLADKRVLPSAREYDVRAWSAEQNKLKEKLNL